MKQYKRVISFLLVAAMVLAQVMIFPAAANAEGVQYDSKPTNIAQGKEGWASSNDRGDHTIGARTVRFLTDGSTDNFIVSHIDDQNPWFYVNLGEKKDINKVVLQWGANAAPYDVDAYAKKYEVQVSDTGLDGSWKTVYTEDNGHLGEAVILFTSVNTQYVRVYVQQKANQYAALKEMFIYETDFDNMPDPEAIKVLYIGNSHTYTHDVPGIVRDLFTANGKTIVYQEITAGGQTLEWHSNQAATITTILEGDFDYVVLQEKASGFDSAVFARGVDKLYDAIKQTTAKPILYMIWSNENLPLVQKTIAQAYLDAANKIGAKVAAVGVAFDIIRHNHTDIDLYMDGNHATPIGAYLAASDLYYTLSQTTDKIIVAPNDALVARLGLTVANCQLIQDTVFPVYQKGLDYMGFLWQPFAIDGGNLMKLVGDSDFTLTASGGENTSVVTWKSSNPAVATITSDGVVTIVNAGSTTITANKAADGTNPAVSASIVLTVKSVVGIEMVTPPDIEAYPLGQDLNLRGCKIAVTFNDYEISQIDVTTDMVSGFDNSKRGIQTLTVTYKGKTTALSVMVYQPGDVNNDGAINITDARTVLQRTVNKIDDDALNILAADVNGDDQVNLTDARLILQYSVKKITEFPSPIVPS